MITFSGDGLSSWIWKNKWQTLIGNVKKNENEKTIQGHSLINYILKILKKIKTSLFQCTDNQIKRCTEIQLTLGKKGNENHILYTEKTGKLEQMTLIRKTKFIH